MGWIGVRRSLECVDQQSTYDVSETDPMVVVTITITKSDDTELASPFRVGISATTSDGTVHDRTQHLKATVSPLSEVGNVTIQVSSGLTLSNQHVSGATITFDVVGKTKSETKGDNSIKAIYSSQVQVSKTVSVVVPSQIGTPHDTTGSGLVSENKVEDSTTFPPFQGLSSGQVALVTNYARYLSITVLDKFGDQVGGLYQGAEVTELPQGASQYVNINSPLTTSSTYLDPVGETRLFDVVAKGSADAAAWPSHSLQPMVSGGLTQFISVRVDGFDLLPSVDSRTWTATPPSTLTISWPN